MSANDVEQQMQTSSDHSKQSPEKNILYDAKQLSESESSLDNSSAYGLEQSYTVSSPCTPRYTLIKSCIDKMPDGRFLN